MSHDRGCACGREKYEYADCNILACNKKNGETMELAKKLKETLDILDQAKITDANDQYNADMMRIRAERSKRKEWLDSVKNSIVDQIKRGKVPHVEIREKHQLKWLIDAQKQEASHQDLWNDFRQFFRNERLEPTINDKNIRDINSYGHITVTILPNKTRGYGLKEEEDWCITGDYKE